MNEHIIKQEFPRKARHRQEQLRVGHRACWSDGTSNQAHTWEKPQGWFIKALERFANCGDSPENYQALSKAFPSFWPLPLYGGGHNLAWVPEARRLFLLYRNLLRRFWMRHPDALKDGLQIGFLFGTVAGDEMQKILAGELFISRTVEEAIAPLRSSYPGLCLPSCPSPLARFWVQWTAGTVEYISQIDFQRAVWLLFRESWRAKVCPKCSAYFLVQKSAQLYCSLSCSNSAHQASSLRWWKEKGARRRAARTKAKHAERKSR